MKKQVYENKVGSLTGRQWLMGLIQAVFAPLLLKIAEVASSGSIQFDWKELLAIGIASAAPYIARKLAEANKVTVASSDDEKSGPHPPGSPIWPK